MPEELYHVAAIVNDAHEIRVVVGTIASIRANVDEGERYYVVPDLLVPQPVPFNQAQSIIKRASDHAARMWGRSA